MSGPRTLVLALAIAAVPDWAVARPGNPDRYPVGAEATGMGGAGVAAGRSAWHNPAGLGTLTDQGLSASLSAYGYTGELAPEFVDATYGGAGLIGELDNNAIDVFPASLEFVKPLGAVGPLVHGLGLSIVVPDYDQFDGILDVPATSTLFEIRARRLSASRTYWIMPGWGGCLGDLCFGAGPAVAFFASDAVSITTLFNQFSDGTTFDSTESYQSRVIVGAVGGQAGAQWQVNDELRLGLTVRSPVGKFFTWSEFLNVLSVVDTSTGEAYIDRVETQDPYTDFRLPWRFVLGAAYEVPKSWAVAADVRVTFGLSDYVWLAGPNGEATMLPTVPGGTVTDPSRAVEVQRVSSLVPAVNFNAGGKLYVLDDLAVQLGLFSDLSATPAKNVLRYGEDRVSRLGATAGVAWITEPVTAWATVIYARGWGQVMGLGGESFSNVAADLTSQSVLISLGTSADL